MSLRRFYRGEMNNNLKSKIFQTQWWFLRNFPFIREMTNEALLDKIDTTPWQKFEGKQTPVEHQSHYSFMPPPPIISTPLEMLKTKIIHEDTRGNTLSLWWIPLLHVPIRFSINACLITSSREAYQPRSTKSQKTNIAEYNDRKLMVITILYTAIHLLIRKKIKMKTSAVQKLKDGLLSSAICYSAFFSLLYMSYMLTSLFSSLCHQFLTNVIPKATNNSAWPLINRSSNFF